MSTAHKVQWPSVLAGLQGITWADFPREISAGITLAALIIPLNIGYAQVAGLPPVFGLYAGIIPLAIYALFTSSRHVVFGPLRAVNFAFLLATIDLLRRASRPRTWVLREALDGSHFAPEETDPAPDTNGIIIYRFGASLYFANAAFFEEEVEKLVDRAATPVKWFVLDAQAMNDIDTTGAETLHQVLQRLKGRGVSVSVTRANPATTALLAHYHCLERIGENRTYPTNRHAIAAFRHETG